MHRMTYSSYTGIRSTKNVHPEICSPDGRLDIDIFSLFYFFAFHSGIFAVINFAFGFAIRTDFEVTGSFLFWQFGHERYGFVFADGFYFFVSAFFLCAAVDFVTGSLGYFFPGESYFVFSGIFDEVNPFFMVHAFLFGNIRFGNLQCMTCYTAKRCTRKETIE